MVSEVLISYIYLLQTQIMCTNIQAFAILSMLKYCKLIVAGITFKYKQRKSNLKVNTLHCTVLYWKWLLSLYTNQHAQSNQIANLLRCTIFWSILTIILCTMLVVSCCLSLHTPFPYQVDVNSSMVWSANHYYIDRIWSFKMVTTKT